MCLSMSQGEECPEYSICNKKKKVGRSFINGNRRVVGERMEGGSVPGPILSHLTVNVCHCQCSCMLGRQEIGKNIESIVVVAVQKVR